MQQQPIIHFTWENYRLLYRLFKQINTHDEQDNSHSHCCYAYFVQLEISLIKGTVVDNWLNKMCMHELSEVIGILRIDPAKEANGTA